MNAQLFWRKVDKSAVFGCWNWTGRVVEGYGRFTNAALAHRVSYEIAVGPIPAGLTIDHLCRNPLCVNPQHLQPVTLQENVARGVRATSTHCRKCGTEYNHANTYINPSGARRCRQCQAAAVRRYRSQLDGGER